MRAIHRSRIDGAFLLVLLLGIACGMTLGKYSFIGFVPLAAIWLMEYDINSHEEKEQNKKRIEPKISINNVANKGDKHGG